MVAGNNVMGELFGPRVGNAGAEVWSDSDIDPLATLILTPSGGGSNGAREDVLVSPTTEVPRMPAIVEPFNPPAGDE